MSEHPVLFGFGRHHPHTARIAAVAPDPAAIMAGPAAGEIAGKPAGAPGDETVSSARLAASLIELQHIVKVYPMGERGVEALQDINLRIAAGEFVAITGPSGCGKSTLMNILGCLDRPTSGRYLLQGRNVAGLRDDEQAMVRNRTIGFVFQSFNLLGLTSALQNVELPLVYAGVSAHQRADRARAALEAVGLGGRLHHRPNQLSGGQQQRVALARALVVNPSILLADEPTGNLDSHAGHETMELIQSLHRARQITIILVTHEVDIAAYAERELRMRDGRILSDVRQRPRTL